jgi:hypothetical protein
MTTTTDEPDRCEECDGGPGECTCGDLDASLVSACADCDADAGVPCDAGCTGKPRAMLSSAPETSR